VTKPDRDGNYLRRVDSNGRVLVGKDCAGELAIVTRYGRCAVIIVRDQQSQAKEPPHA
jgi:hypothetical protein